MTLPNSALNLTLPLPLYVSSTILEATQSEIECVATIIRPVRRSRCVVSVIGRGVDADRDPGQKTVSNVRTEVHVVDNGIVGGGGLLNGPHIIIVGKDFDSVGVVGSGGFDRTAEVFFVVNLADMRHYAAGVGAVWQQRAVDVDDGVGVGCTALTSSAMWGNETMPRERSREIQGQGFNILEQLDNRCELRGLPL